MWPEALQTTPKHKCKDIRQTLAEQYNQLIKDAERAHWRASVHDAATTREGIWKIANWARTKSYLPLEPAKIPDLNWNDKVYCTTEQKAEAL